MVGGDAQILKDLRASILGRKKKSGREARLLVLVEAWMEGRGDRDVLREESDGLGREIRHCRRQMQSARRQQRRNIEDGIFDGKACNQDNQEVEESYEKSNNKQEYDFEGSIIDFYANLMSKTNLGPVEGMHPAFRDSVVFDPLAGTFHRIFPGQQSRNTVYSQSAYSDSGYCASTSKQSLDTHNRTAEKHAQAYRELVEIEEEEEPAEERRSQRRRIRRTG